MLRSGGIFGTLKRRRVVHLLLPKSDARKVGTSPRPESVGRRDRLRFRRGARWLRRAFGPRVEINVVRRLHHVLSAAYQTCAERSQIDVGVQGLVPDCYPVLPSCGILGPFPQYTKVVVSHLVETNVTFRVVKKHLDSAGAQIPEVHQIGEVSTVAVVQARVIPSPSDMIRI